MAAREDKTTERIAPPTTKQMWATSLLKFSHNTVVVMWGNVKMKTLVWLSEMMFVILHNIFW